MLIMCTLFLLFYISIIKNVTNVNKETNVTYLKVKERQEFYVSYRCKTRD